MSKDRILYAKILSRNISLCNKTEGRWTGWETWQIMSSLVLREPEWIRKLGGSTLGCSSIHLWCLKTLRAPWSHCSPLRTPASSRNRAAASIRVTHWRKPLIGRKALSPAWAVTASSATGALDPRSSLSSKSVKHVLSPPLPGTQTT